MKVSLIQMESKGNKVENANKALKMMEQSIEEKPDIICLSELFLSWGKDFSRGIIEIDEIKPFQDFAQKYNVNVILGSVALKDNKVNQKGFTVDETEDTIAGNKLGIIKIDKIKIGIAICFDLRFPEYFRELIKQDVQIVFLPAHFRSNTGKMAWKILPEARAIENQVYFCACNQTGEELCGNTKIISYNGEIISKIEKEEGIISAELNINEQEKFRKMFPVLEQI